MRYARRFVVSVTFALSSAAFGQTPARVSASRPDPHSTEEWSLVAPHLADPLTSSPALLETTGDVLRARRFPDDALTYYKAAVNRGGDINRLLKKEGVLHLELQHGVMARLCFQQATRLNKKDSEGWNNMGASDFMLGNGQDAIKEYKRAVKLNGKSAVFHSNLSLAYFELRDSRNARRELARAVALDPEVMHHGGTGGYNLQILAATHYAEICFEMARVSAAQGDAENTISWLTKAADRGWNVRGAMKNDPQLGAYLQNERVQMMLANTDQMHLKETASRVKPPSLGLQSEGR